MAMYNDLQGMGMDETCIELRTGQEEDADPKGRILELNFWSVSSFLSQTLVKKSKWN